LKLGQSHSISSTLLRAVLGGSLILFQDHLKQELLNNNFCTTAKQLVELGIITKHTYIRQCNACSERPATWAIKPISSGFYHICRHV